LFSDDLEAIGRPIPVEGAAEWNATPLSFGEFEGPALVLDVPINADNVTPGFVLVCPSTDPAWVPLFLKAGALVMESGGVLSHGAIVAREFGIPAVAGIANVHRRLQTGQRLKVDGSSGKVHVFDFANTTPTQ
jgi:pyruvate,water dikinase